MRSSRLAVAVLLGTFASASPALAQRCTDLVSRVDRILPAEVGDPSAVEAMLGTGIARPQLSEVFDPAAAAAAVGDPGLRLDRDSCDPPEEDPPASLPAWLVAKVEHLLGLREHHRTNCNYRGDGGSQMRVREGDGRYAYVNPSRSHQGATRNEVTEAEAAERALAALEEFGVPPSEIDQAEVDIAATELTGWALGARGEPMGEKLRARAEVQVLYPRKVGGAPVFDSFGRAAIDSEGRIARLHVRWPDFCVAEGASVDRTLARREMLQAIVEAIERDNPCELIGGIGAKLAWVGGRSLTNAIVGSGDDADERGGSPDGCFVPAVIVAVAGPSPEEDSGEISVAGQLLAIPLLGASAQEPDSGSEPRLR